VANHHYMVAAMLQLFNVFQFVLRFLMKTDFGTPTHKCKEVVAFRIIIARKHRQLIVWLQLLYQRRQGIAIVVVKAKAAQVFSVYRKINASLLFRFIYSTYPCAGTEFYF